MVQQDRHCQEAPYVLDVGVVGADACVKHAHLDALAPVAQVPQLVAGEHEGHPLALQQPAGDGREVAVARLPLLQQVPLVLVQALAGARV